MLRMTIRDLDSLIQPMIIEDVVNGDYDDANESTRSPPFIHFYSFVIKI